MALLENQKQLETARDPMNYAATLCRNHIHELRRNVSRHTVEAESLDDPRVFHKAAKFSASTTDELMAEAMKGLTPEEREVITRLYEDGFTRSETAAILGVHANTVDNRAKSGVDKLKLYFGEK